MNCIKIAVHTGNLTASAQSVNLWWQVKTRPYRCMSIIRQLIEVATVRQMHPNFVLGLQTRESMTACQNTGHTESQAHLALRTTANALSFSCETSTNSVAQVFQYDCASQKWARQETNEAHNSVSRHSRLRLKGHRKPADKFGSLISGGQ